MDIRDIQSGDMERLKKLHAECGFDYEFPALEGPLFILKKTVEVDGQIVVAGMIRLTAEAYILGDPNWMTPAFRLKALELLHETLRKELKAKGLDDVHCWIPPQLKGFGRRLVAYFGWYKPRWEDYVRTL